MKIRGRTIRTLEGLLLSLLLHLLIFLWFFLAFEDLKFPTPPSPKSKKISLNLKQVITAPPARPALKPIMPSRPKMQPVRPKLSQPKPQPVIQPKPKPAETVPVKKTPLKAPAPVAKKKLLDEKTRLVVEKKEREENNVTKIVKKKEKPRKIVKQKVEKPRKKVARQSKPHRPRKPSRHRNRLASALMGSGRSVSLAPSRPASASYSSQMIQQLYGSEFDRFTPTQKKFIKKNLSLIHRITQRTLIQNGYPDVAVRTRQEGTNVVTFYLHPNGSISGLRLQSRIGYTALDNNTLQVIRIAYKDYPRPKTTTKITFYVQYSIY
ncbi:energy transducer TonB [Sulfurovum sp.]|uniref:energy transducer TonB n=1 Tax=Sulfurovum sp. TaxID=1969726 RepID=UPI0025E3E253|nr:energy transducer TonB [Sulfurovum sp.]